MLAKLITGWTYSQRQEVLGWYHIMWLIIMVVGSALVAYFLGRRHDKKTDDRVVLFFGLMLFICEVYKQIFLVKSSGSFNEYLLPFQFCSIPMWVALFAPFVKNGKVKESMFLFLATCGFIAGASTMCYPAGCLRDAFPYITMLIHTMLWHASMVVLGVYLIVSRKYMSDIKKFLSELIPATIWLVGFVVTANVTNIVLYKLGYNVNFMYISPYGGNEIPVLALIRNLSPIGEINFMYFVFFICYILFFMLGMIAVWFSVFGIRKLIGIKKSK